jgi:formate hydrogenlyase transcriptional activator
MTASPSRVLAESDAERFEDLVSALSAQFTQLGINEIQGAVHGAVERLALTLGLDGCSLVEFTESGVAGTVHSWPKTSTETGDRLPAWLLARLSRCELVTDGRADARPHHAISDGRQEGRCWTWIGLPVRVAGRLVCAVAIESRHATRPWPARIVDRLQLIADILGGALERRRQGLALNVSVSTHDDTRVPLEDPAAYLTEEIRNPHGFDEIVGDSRALRLALEQLSQVAPTNASVLILGETGTGKELFARALHARSQRSGRPMIRLNCAALPPTLVESELFGHEKGAFTGAVSVRQGRFELADRATIFLDEIGDLPLDLQVKLLRVLQEGEFERVGSSRTMHVDVRVIAATHRDLETAVAEGRFRADLYYRLTVFPVHLPSLKERPEDIPHLVWFFIHRFQRELGRRISKVPMELMKILQRHSWPGNVRELENVVERAMIQSTGDTLRFDHTFDLTARHLHKGPTPGEGTLEDVQRAHIAAILDACGWRINGKGNAAERLGIHPNTLRFRMNKLGIISRVGRSSSRPLRERASDSLSPPR